MPAVLAGLENKTGKPDAWNAVYNHIRHDGGSTLLDMDNTVPGGPGSHMPAGNKFLSEIFGSNLATVQTTISHSAGIKASSATAVLEYVGPLVLGFLGKMTKAENLDAGGLASFLSEQNAGIRSALPTDLAELPGFGDLRQTEPLTTATSAPVIATPTSPPSNGRPVPPPSAKKTNWLWLVLLALAVVLLVFGLRNCGNNQEQGTTRGAETTKMDTTAPHTFATTTTCRAAAFYPIGSRNVPVTEIEAFQV